MQFKHPDILFFLFLLLIPVFIHLFQLRRFQKIPFTNVDFLKKITLQTRKSSRLKKWLTLLFRLLALSSVILAFAQPYIPSKSAPATEKDIVIYLDNSFSMEAKGRSGPLLQRAVQDLYEEADQLNSVSWFTNNSERKNSSVADFKNEILKLDYTSGQLSPSQVILKARQLFSDENSKTKKLIFISDFQQKENFPQIPENMEVDAVWLQPVKPSNISIDTAFIASKTGKGFDLAVQVSKQGEETAEVPISLYKNGKIAAKTAVDLSDKQTEIISFSLSTREAFQGKLEIHEPSIRFDNSLFFSFNTPEKIKTLAINAADGKFLDRLFPGEDFELTRQNSSNLNYNTIPNQHFIVLNELEEIPGSLISALRAFSDSGGSILIIPAPDSNLDQYNPLLNALNLGNFLKPEITEKKLTKIRFSHPLFDGVFEKEITNFQYPVFNSSFSVRSAAASVLSFADDSPALLQSGKNYLFTAGLNKENSNFLNSPLIVPVLYNMAVQSLPMPDLYFVNGIQKTFSVPAQLGPDQILTVRDSTDKFIPQQQTRAHYVEITTSDLPEKSGNYRVVHEDDKTVQLISYNYDRAESRLVYQNPEQWEEVAVYSTVSRLFDSMDSGRHMNTFWKWFVIFAVFFLLCEMAVLKFIKS